MENFDTLLGKGRDELLKIYRKLAKRADQRLVRLEKYGEKRKYVLDWAYKKAAYEASLYAGEKKEKPRFNIKPPKSDKSLMRKIAAMQNFLDMKTSTKKGIKEVDAKRLETLNDKFSKLDSEFGDIPLDDWLMLHESGVFKRVDDIYGFYTTMEAIGSIQNSKEKIKKWIKDAEDENKTIDEIKSDISEKIKKEGYAQKLEKAIDQILTKEGLDLNKLL